MIWFQVHRFLVQRFWRIIAPKHPRGWLDMHCLYEEVGGDSWIHCHGMERWNRANLEIVNVPEDLRGYAHGLLCDVADYMKNEKPVKPDEHIHIMSSGEGQMAVENATLRVKPDPIAEHENMLRIVDYMQPVTAGFPFRLLAARLLAVADRDRRPARRETLCRRAIQIYPGEPSGKPEDSEEFNPGDNENNVVAYFMLSFAAAEQDRFDEAVTLAKTAVARSPRSAKLLASGMVEACAGRNDPYARFWREGDEKT